MASLIQHFSRQSIKTTLALLVSQMTFYLTVILSLLKLVGIKTLIGTLSGSIMHYDDKGLNSLLNIHLSQINVQAEKYWNTVMHIRHMNSNKPHKYDSNSLGVKIHYVWAFYNFALFTKNFALEVEWD